MRFDFVGRPAGAIKPFIVGGLLTLISLGLLAPLASRWVGAFVGGNLRFGGKAFEAKPALLPLYRGLFIGLGLGIAVAIFHAAVMMGSLRISGAFEAGSESPGMATLLLISFSGYAILLTVFVISAFFYRAAVRNVVWRASTYDDAHRFRSNLSRGRYAWIAISNTVVTILSLWLMRPWAAVRMARYIWERTGVLIAGNVETLMSEVEEQASAVGAEFIEFEGVDFGF